MPHIQSPALKTRPANTQSSGIDLSRLTIATARASLVKKEFSAVELTTAYLENMARHKALNAYITETPEHALTAAAAADQRIAKGEMLPLDGIPIGMKDIFCTKNIRTTAGSRMLENFVPPYESTVSQNLHSSGAVMLGKLNMDEFAMGSSNLTSAFGPAINPWKETGSDDDLVPGGSSGGSSVAVAADLCLGATGTDTGGSIRQPASFCGLVGLKPSYGRCSRWGMIAFSSSLDQAGPLTKTVEDAALMLSVMASGDEKDATSVHAPLPDFTTALQGNVKGLRVGIPKEYDMKEMPFEIKRFWEAGAAALKAEGAEIIPVSLPHTHYALPAYYIIAPAEASSNLARYDGVRYGYRHPDVKNLEELYVLSRSHGFGAEVKRRLMIGTHVLSAGYYDAYYTQAQKVRRLIVNDFETVFEKVDVLLTPTTPNTAFSVKNPPTDPVAMYMNDVFSVPASMAGLPAICVPAGLSETGLPLGLQAIGPKFREDLVLQVATAMERTAQSVWALSEPATLLGE